MFTDEIYEEILINKEGKITTAHAKVCEQKLGEKDFTTALKQIENGYQLFRKKHPEYPEDSFRRYCFVQESRGGVHVTDAKKLFAYLKWNIKPEYLTIGQ